MFIGFSKVRNMFLEMEGPPDDTGPEVCFPGLCLSHLAAGRLRELLGSAPTMLSEEQIEVARFESELDAAWEDGRISGWHYIRSETREACNYRVVGSVTFWTGNDARATSRLDAARLAAEYVRGLSVLVRDVEGMSSAECSAEMEKRGWLWINTRGWCGWIREDVAIDDRVFNNRDAVTRARALDDDGE